jgi:hypothetical protein
LFVRKEKGDYAIHVVWHPIVMSDGTAKKSSSLEEGDPLFSLPEKNEFILAGTSPPSRE